ncbi:hypothetical protein [Rickettsiella endosymbiont of Rhagonycha lignosa]|uniref:hypothetical protein n=1 Tax=Rickettsiella endosymbiont of Rhagonycha lignosa TaxID=3077937 RepID=UPI00313D79AA
MEAFTLDLESNFSQKKIKKKLFPDFKLSKSDYFLGGFLFLFCNISLVHADIYLIGWSSLNFLFGNPLEFYENCRHFLTAGSSPAAGYPPTTFAIFAAWLYPFKALGLIKSPLYLPTYLVYWLKSLTFIFYIATGNIFYKITQIYCPDKLWGKYATWVWLTAPMALFSQAIVSQTDIFYLFFTLMGFLFFLRKKIYLASVIFSIAITFKYFPLFVFLPLLFFYEKKILKLILCLSIFCIPLLLVKLLYGQSPAFVEGVLNFFALPRVFSSSMDVGGIKVYGLFLSFAILLGVSYSLNSENKNSLRIAAYIFLVSSILPFLFMLCHPGWVIFFTPAIVLTTMLESKEKIKQFFLLDLIGLLTFLVFIWVLFQDNVDSAMFQSSIFHISFNNHYKLANFFTLDGNILTSAGIFFSGFIAYLCLQIILKYPYSSITNQIDNKVCFYKNIRIRYYFSLLIFIIPVLLVVYISHTSKYIHSETNSNGFCIASLKDYTVGDKIIARCPIFSLISEFISNKNKLS